MFRSWVILSYLRVYTTASLSTHEWPFIRLFLELSVLTFYIQLRTGDLYVTFPPIFRLSIASLGHHWNIRSRFGTSLEYP